MKKTIMLGMAFAAALVFTGCSHGHHHHHRHNRGASYEYHRPPPPPPPVAHKKWPHHAPPQGVHKSANHKPNGHKPGPPPKK